MIKRQIGREAYCKNAKFGCLDVKLSNLTPLFAKIL